jgi:CAAX protease family protein
LWHLPSVLLPAYLRGELTPGVVGGVLFGLTIGIVGWTIVLTWFYNNTESVFWIVVIDGWLNTRPVVPSVVLG